MNYLLLARAVSKTITLIQWRVLKAIPGEGLSTIFLVEVNKGALCVEIGCSETFLGVTKFNRKLIFWDF